MPRNLRQLVDQLYGSRAVDPRDAEDGEPPDFSTQYNTALSPADEAQFEAWAKAHGRERDSFDYDMRGYWKGATPQDRESHAGHFTDQYKKPNHPTFSVESIYNGAPDGSGGQYLGGQWSPDSFRPGATNMYGSGDLQRYFKRVEPNFKIASNAIPGGDVANIVNSAYQPEDDGGTPDHIATALQLAQEHGPDVFRESVQEAQRQNIANHTARQAAAQRLTDANARAAALEENESTTQQIAGALADMLNVVAGQKPGATLAQIHGVKRQRRLDAEGRAQRQYQTEIAGIEGGQADQQFANQQTLFAQGQEKRTQDLADQKALADLYRLEFPGKIPDGTSPGAVIAMGKAVLGPERAKALEAKAKADALAEQRKYEEDRYQRRLKDRPEHLNPYDPNRPRSRAEQDAFDRHEEQVQTAFGRARSPEAAKHVNDSQASYLALEAAITTVLEARKAGAVAGGLFSAPEDVDRKERAKAAAADARIAMKDMAKLGALNGQDYQLLDAQIPVDPTAYQLSRGDPTGSRLLQTLASAKAKMKANLGAYLAEPVATGAQKHEVSVDVPSEAPPPQAGGVVYYRSPDYPGKRIPLDPSEVAEFLRDHPNAQQVQ